VETLGAGGGTGTAPTSTGGAGGAPAGVRGSLVDTHLTDTGAVQHAPDPASLTVAALVPSAGGGFDTFPGTLQADGAFSIPGVPQGAYYLDTRGPTAAPTAVVTTARNVDLGLLLGGRPDAVAITSTTPLVLDATLPAPWQDGDMLMLFSLGAGAWGELYSDLAQTAGETTLTGYTYDCSLLSLPYLVDAGKGDKAYLTHLNNRPLGAGTYLTLDSVYGPPSWTQKEGMLSKLHGAFAAVPLQHVSLVFQRSAFDALIPAGNPAATLALHDVSAYVEPAGAGRSSGTAPPTLFDAGDTDSGDVTLELDYGNPFPAAWSEVGTASAVYSIKLDVPWMGFPSSASGSVFLYAPLAALAAGPITPMVGPPGDVRINGQPAAAGLTSVGQTPKITWSAPALGHADMYRVVVSKVEEGSRTRAGTVLTQGTEITLPPGILAPGSRYYLRITAQQGAYDPAQPYQWGESAGFADAITNILQP
jgi:hypothetical protein